MHEACAAPPACGLDADGEAEPLAPTLAKYADPDTSQLRARERVAAWASQNFNPGSYAAPRDVDLVQPCDALDESAASWLYIVTDHPFRVILDAVSGWSAARKMEVLDTALEGRHLRDEFMQPFRSGYRYVFDIVCDIGAYRDMHHRHRRCQQIRQAFSDRLGCERPELLDQAGVGEIFDRALAAARGGARRDSRRVRAGQPLLAAVRCALPLVVQDGLCRSRVHHPCPFGRQGSYLLPQDRLGDARAHRRSRA